MADRQPALRLGPLRGLRRSRPRCPDPVRWPRRRVATPAGRGASPSVAASAPCTRRRSVSVARLVDGGPHQRVSKLQVRQIHPDQAGGDSRFKGLGGGSRVDESGRGLQYFGQRLVVVGRSHQQQQPGLTRASQRIGR